MSNKIIPNEFEVIYKMTEYELIKQDTNTLVQHIIDLKKMLSQNVTCACGNYMDITQPHSFDHCVNCVRPICEDYT
jgi:hypothetical protein